MEVFNPGWTFSLTYEVEMSAQRDNKLLFKMTLQLHVKKLARCSKNAVIWKILKPQVNRNLIKVRRLNREHGKDKSKQRWLQSTKSWNL